MNIDPADFEQGPEKTDSGIDIQYHAQNGHGQNTIALAGIPHDKVEQSPIVYVNGVKYVHSHIDEESGNLIFVEFGAEPVKTGSPTLPSEFDVEGEEAAVGPLDAQ